MSWGSSYTFSGTETHRGVTRAKEGWTTVVDTSWFTNVWLQHWSSTWQRNTHIHTHKADTQRVESQVNTRSAIRSPCCVQCHGRNAGTQEEMLFIRETLQVSVCGTRTDPNTPHPLSPSYTHTHIPTNDMSVSRSWPSKINQGHLSKLRHSKKVYQCFMSIGSWFLQLWHNNPQGCFFLIMTW